MVSRASYMANHTSLVPEVVGKPCEQAIVYHIALSATVAQAT